MSWRAAGCAIAGALAIGLAGVALVDASPASADSPAPVCVGTACTVTFSTPGVGLSWVVPTGVTSASFTLYGAVGGSEGSIPGGDGAKITGTLSVTPGAALIIDVGKAGANGVSTGGAVNGGGVGGFGSDGGGGSDVKVGGADQLAAGGGGGAGASGGGAACTSPASVNGGLGGNADTAGGPGGTLTVGTGPGAGTLGGGLGASPGTTIAGGAGGTGGVASFTTTTCGATTVTSQNGGTGDPGSANQGGLGGGGGGGGGYFGGGGGGNRSADNNNPFSDNAGGGGGGGGSSFGIAGSDFVLVSDTANPSNRSLNSGNGQVMISYTVPTMAPAVTTQPTSQSVPSGGTLTFTAGASGTPTPTVQWQYSIDGGSTWANLPGATSPSLTASSLTALVNGWEVRAVFTNAGGTATSNAATITITPAATVVTAAATSTPSSSSGTPALADTGFNAWRLVDGGALMVAVGSAFVALSRRRRRVIRRG
jgi:hypothetical protein